MSAIVGMTFDFEEDKHPRDEKGRWAHAGGGLMVHAKAPGHIHRAARDVMKTAPEHWTRGTHIEYDKNSQRSGTIGNTIRLGGEDPTLTREGTSYRSGDMNGDRLTDKAHAREYADDKTIRVVDHMPTESARQVIAHELGHVAHHGVDPATAAKVTALAQAKDSLKFITPTIAQYAAYFTDRASSGDFVATRGAASGGYRLASERVAEAARLRLTDPSRYRRTVPPSLRKAVDLLWRAPRQKHSAESFEAKPKVATARASGSMPNIAKELKTVFEASYRDAATRVASLRGTEALLTDATDAAEEYARTRAGDAISDIDETTADRVKSIIGDSIANETDPTDRLSRIFGEERASLIAETETNTAFNMGTIRALMDAGEEYVYVTDGDYDEDCASANDSIWTLEEAEANPLEHPNCVRDFRPLTAEELADTLAEEADDESQTSVDPGIAARLESLERKVFGDFDEEKHPRDERVAQQFYSEDQLRDENGRWTTGGGSKAWNGKTMTVKSPHLSWRATGRIGEHVIKHYLENKGLKVEQTSLTRSANFPVDLVTRNEVIECKAGLVSNGPSGWQWRLTLGEPHEKEAAWLKKATPEQKARHNERKMQAVLDRKERARQELSKEMGRPLKATTFAVILHPDTGKADLYRFDGFHPRIGWKGEMAKKGFVGTMSYGRKK